MKKTLYLVLKNSEQAYKTLQELKTQGYNATVISTESLRHAIDYHPEEHHFYNLRHFEQKELNESFLCLFVIDDQNTDHLKGRIRNLTDNFTSVKGFMFSKLLEDFEGSI